MLDCDTCHSRCFLHGGLDSMRGLAVVPWLLDWAFKQRREDPHFKQSFDGMMTTLIAKVKAAQAIPLETRRQQHEGLHDQPLSVPFYPDHELVEAK